MNDEAAFVAAIAAAPEDTHLPLIFADWLDDRGDPRGPWVRNGYVHEWMRPDYQSPVPKLLESLRKDKRVIDVRRAAEVIGEPIVPGLAELLKHETPRVREQACLCLRRIAKRAKEAVPALLAVLSDPSSSVREQAAKALKDIGTRDVAPTETLKAALNDDNWSVRRMASKVLGSMGAKRSVLQELIEKYESPVPSDRFEVVEGLAELGTVDVVPVLDKALDDPEPEVRERAVTALGRTKLASAAEPLHRAMQDTSAKVRIAAARQFGRYNWYMPLTASAVAAVSALLGDPVEEVRVAACNTLAHTSDELAGPVVPRIIQLFGELSGKVRSAAVGALGEIGKGSAPALRALIDELDDLDAEYRRSVVRAIGQIGLNDPAALQALLPLLRDHGHGVAAAVTHLLGEWEVLPAGAAPALLVRAATARAGNDDSELSAALTALGRVENPPPAVLDVLREGLRDAIGYGWGRTAALRSLARLGPDALPALPDVLEVIQTGHANWHYEAAQLAARALLAMGPPGGAELVRLLDENEDARWRIIGAMREVGPDALPLLPAYLRAFNGLAPDEYRRAHLLEAIRNLGPSAADVVVPYLLAILDGDSAGYIKVSTLHALQGFGAAVLPHLPQLVELSERPELADRLDSFASVFAAFAPDAAVREPLRECLRRAVASSDNAPSYAHQQTRWTCAAALAKYRDPALLPELAPLITGSYDVPFRCELVGHLLQFDSPAVVPLLCRLLTDTDDGARLRAAEGLSARADASDETVAALVQALEDRLPKVRRAAADALAKLGVVTDAVLAALQAATEDADKQTAARAGVALRKLTPKPAKVKSKKPSAATKAEKKPG